MTTEDDKGVLSHTEDEATDNEIEDENESLPVEYPGTVIPDPHPDQIEADQDLTAQFPDDADYIELIHLKIHSLEDLKLARFTKLEALNLRQNLITLIVALNEVLPTLEELDLYDNRINHISSNIRHLVNLLNLDFSFNNIKTIKNIDTLVNVENLYFVQNKIKQIQNVEHMPKLVNLELGGNRIEQIENLNISLLTQLWLGKNRIPRLENLDHLTKLRVLSIQLNRIRKIEGLDKLEALEELYLSHNGIETLEGLENNKKLQVLDVTLNKLTKLQGLSHLTELTDFWASYNQIDLFDDIGRELGKLPELDTVYFEGNPVQTLNPTAYRRKLRLYLGPSLQKIDATYVKS